MKKEDKNKSISKEAKHQNEVIQRRDSRKHIEDLIKSMKAPEAPSFFDGFFKQ